MTLKTKLTLHLQFHAYCHSHFWIVPALQIHSDNVLHWNQVSDLLQVIFLKWKYERYSCQIRSHCCDKSHLHPSADELCSKFDKNAIDTLYRLVEQISLRLHSLGFTLKSQLRSYFSSVTGGDDSMGVLWRGDARIGSIRLYSTTFDGSTTSQKLVQEILLPHYDAKPEVETVCTSPQSLLDSIKDNRTRNLISEMLQVTNDAENDHRPWIIILRGIPGSGKSTVARQLSRILPQIHWKVSICSADLYFEGRRGYRFDRNKLGIAHRQCFHTFKREIRACLDPENRDSQRVIVVDNTNVTRREYAQYITTSYKFYCVRVRIVEIQCIDIGTAFAMARRNSHGVPIDRVLQMWMRWEDDKQGVILHPMLCKEESRIMSFLTHRLGSEAWSGGPGYSLPTVLYVCLLLPQQERSKLLAAIPPKFRRVVADHITLFYKPTREYLRSVDFGCDHAIEAVNVCSDNRANVLKIKLDSSSDLLLRQKYPHITYSLAPKVRPVYSSMLLKLLDELDCPWIETQVCSLPIDVKLGMQIAMNGASISHACRSLPWNFRCHSASPKFGGAIRVQEVVVVYVESPQIDLDYKVLEKHLMQRLTSLQRLKYHIGSFCTSLRVLCIEDRKGLVSMDSIFAPLRPKQLRFHVCERISSDQQAANRIEQVIKQSVCDTDHIPKIIVIHCTFIEDQISLDNSFWLCEALANRFHHPLVCYVPLPFLAGSLDSLELCMSSCKVSNSSSKTNQSSECDFRLVDAMDLLEIGPSEVIQTQIAQISHHLKQGIDRAALNDAVEYTVRRIDTSLGAMDAMGTIDLLVIIRTPIKLSVSAFREKIAEWLRNEEKIPHVIVTEPFVTIRLCATYYYLMQNFRILLCYNEDDEVKNDNTGHVIEHEWMQRYDHCESQVTLVKSQLSEAVELYILLVAFIREVVCRRPCNQKRSTGTANPITLIDSSLTIASEILVYEFLLQNIERNDDTLKLTEGMLCICRFWRFIDHDWERLSMLLRERMDRHASEQYFTVIRETAQCLNVEIDQEIHCKGTDVYEAAKMLLSMLYVCSTDDKAQVNVIEGTEADVYIVGEELSNLTLNES
uniref:Uncharacterized protein AlNc14C164G7849 n=1 Tax=Albugo laibachii Nc14 TaxID=890382 RepID=F0WN17_9STRA|nr:conserved hypothetical protein [Albugo laibachii Nc14]|eukprot:CCA22704.1 conserved hypothetical protein [Albugo laibachii Nc14]